MKNKVIMTALSAAASCGLQADPISGTGFSADAIAEKEGANPDEVTDYGGLARWVFAEEGRGRQGSCAPAKLLTMEGSA